jgi:Dynamin family
MKDTEPPANTWTHMPRQAEAAPAADKADADVGESSGDRAFNSMEHRRERLIGLMEDLVGVTENLSIQPFIAQAAEVLHRIRSETFVVLVAGEFRRGKSTLINALLGEKVLPAFATPTTAVLTEVCWGEEQEAVLYRLPAKGRDPGPPERVPVAELTDRIVINSDAPNPYGRAVVYWPLDLCRRGVVLVDSPGLNEDPRRQAVTLEYMRVADAVILVQDAQANMSMSETDFLRIYLDSHDPFFVINKINFIDEDERPLVQQNAAARIRKERGDSRRYDMERLFFVNALAGLQARRSGDAQMWRASQMAKLSDALAAYLATDRHKAKVIVAARSISQLCQLLSDSVTQQKDLLTSNLHDLTESYERQQEPLHRLELEAERISRRLRDQISDLGDMIEDRIDGQLRVYVNRLPEWGAEVDPENRLTMAPWKVREQAEAVAKEVAAQLGGRVVRAFAAWTEQELLPRYTERITSIGEELSRSVSDFEKRLEQVRLDVSGIASQAAGAAAVGDQSRAKRITVGVGGWLLAGPAVGVIGLRLGPKEAMRALWPSLAITLAWMFTPLGWAFLAAGLVAQAFWQGGPALRRAQNNIKEMVAGEMAKQLRERAAEQARQSASAVVDDLRPFQEQVEQELRDRIVTFRDEMEKAMAAKRAGEQDVARRGAELSELGRRVERALFVAQDLVTEVAALLPKLPSASTP